MTLFVVAVNVCDSVNVAVVVECDSVNFVVAVNVTLLLLSLLLM